MLRIILIILFINLTNSMNTFKNSFECNQLSPFLWSKLSLSVDLAKFNLFPNREDFFSHNGFRESIFNLTCKEKNKFELRNRILDGHITTYYLPDHMSAKTYTYEDLNLNEIIHHRIYEADEESYQKNMINYLKVDNINEDEKKILLELGYNITNVHELFIGAFKLSHNYMRIRKERMTNMRIPVESRLNVIAGTIKLDDSKMTLTNAFQNEIRNLPSNYEDSISKYETLISTFGTHYFRKFIIGGLAKTSFKLLDEAPIQLDQLSKDEFNNDEPFTFNLTGLEFNVDENFGSNEKYFLSDGKIHKRTINFYGGRIETFNHTLSKWKRTALLDPWIIGGSLEPLSRLIQDKNQKRNFLRAMMAYLDKAEILNLKETCNQLEEVNKNEKWFMNYKTKVDDLNERRFINHSQLVKLSKQLNDDVNIEMRKRMIFNSPAGRKNIFISNLNKIDKENINRSIDSKSTTSYLINSWLIFSILLCRIIEFHHSINH